MRKKVHPILEGIRANTNADTPFGRFLMRLFRATNRNASIDRAQEAELRDLLQGVVAREAELESGINFLLLVTSTAAWLNSCRE